MSTALTDLHLHRRVAALLQPWAGAKPGMTVGIVRDGALVLHESAGLASLELDVPIGPQTCFRIASVSKQFTCAAILLLVAEGKLHPSDPVRTHLPDFPDMGAAVTIDHLMHNSSGVRDMLEIMRQGGVDLGLVVSAQDLLDGIHRQRMLNFAPGSRFLYSNANFLLLGRIVERLSGQALGAFLEERIFAPLGMTRTRHTPDPRTAVPGLASGYLPAEGVFRRASHGFPLGGEGGLVSCVEDLALWDRNFTTGTVGGPGLIEALQQAETFTGGAPNLYLRGLRADTYRGLQTVSHGGLWPGYRTEFLRVPEVGATVIAITNDGGSDPSALAHRVLDVLVQDRPGVHAMPGLPDRARLEAMAGCWIDPVAGATLDISVDASGALVVNQGGAATQPKLAPDGRLAVTHGTILLGIREAGPDRLEIVQDAGHTAMWHLSARGPALPAGLPGRYRSTEMAAEWEFAVGSDGAACVHVAGPKLRGTSWAVSPIEGDLVRVWTPGMLQRAWYDVSIIRNGSAVTGLLVNSNRLKRVGYDRVD